MAISDLDTKRRINRQFKATIGKYTSITKKRSAGLLRNLVEQMGEDIFEMAPVGKPERWDPRYPASPDYIPGTYRGNLRVTINSLPRDYDPEQQDPSGGIFRSELESVLKRLNNKDILQGKGQRVYFFNNVPYKTFIEMGGAIHNPKSTNGVITAAKKLFIRNLKEALAKAKIQYRGFGS